jgi:hypothetical protein
MPLNHESIQGSLSVTSWTKEETLDKYRVVWGIIQQMM